MDNTACYGSAIYGNGSYSNNSIIGNFSVITTIYIFDEASAQHNTITRNIRTSSTEDVNVATIIVTYLSKLNNNNIFNNENTYTLWNQNAKGHNYSDIDATNNWWGTTDCSDIQSQIYDFYDDS